MCSRITGDQDTATSAYLHVTVVKSQRMFLCKLEKQVKEHLVGFVAVLLLLNGTPLPQLTHTLLRERETSERSCECEDRKENPEFAILGFDWRSSRPPLVMCLCL